VNPLYIKTVQITFPFANFAAYEVVLLLYFGRTLLTWIIHVVDLVPEQHTVYCTPDRVR
jgi:hypothetical protein